MRKVLVASAVSVILTFCAPYSPALVASIAAPTAALQQVDAALVHPDGHSPIEE